ncbi:hypothetical protein BE221DRAFT_75522 [Ostreococcus tauri]|uniref:Uncharacterized protein n=1 Tax=Ostreococcus tauri TaxID=70448 RepID=A0A1Y5I8T3_OSTTA|nr:hypothetical protein BE221DRAFT_75522 [Ostreococcus tauri]
MLSMISTTTTTTISARVSSARTRRGIVGRARAPTRARVAIARAKKETKKGFFSADLKGDLESVDGGDVVDALRRGDGEAIAGAVGLIANVVVSYSLWVLFNTGCGLPPGPGGAVGLAEGLSYLVVAGIVLGATVKKFKTGKGISFLVALVGVAVGANQIFHFGFIPDAVPTEGGQCFGK